MTTSSARRGLLPAALMLVFAFLLILAVPATAQEKVVVIPFQPAGNSMPDVGNSMVDSLIFEIHGASGFYAFTRQEVQDARYRLLLQETKDPISSNEAVQLTQHMKGSVFVMGAFQQSKNSIQVMASVGALGGTKLFKVKLKGENLVGIQDQLNQEIKDALSEALRNRDEAIEAKKKKKTPSQELMAELTAEEDPLEQQIASMNAEERHRAALEEFNKGVQIGKNSPEERKQYELALRYDPNLPQAHYNLGVLAYRIGDWEAAATHLREFVRLSPKSPDAAKLPPIIDDAEKRLAREVLKQATVHFTPTLEQQKWSGVEWFNEGLELMESNPSLAMEYFGQAVLKDGKLYQAYYNLGTLHYNRDEYDDALKNFRSYLKAAPPNDQDRRAIESLVQQLEKIR